MFAMGSMGPAPAQRKLISPRKRLVSLLRLTGLLRLACLQQSNHIRRS